MDSFKQQIELYKNKVYIYTFGSTIFVGFLAHAFMMFNKISNHDDIDGLKTGWNTYELGRWGMSIINKLLRVFYGSSVSIPWIYYLVGILLVSLSAVIVVRIFSINNWVLACILGGLMVSFPSLISLYTYTYIVPHFCFSIFLSSLACLVLIRSNDLKGFLISGVLLIFSLSIYQAYIGLASSILVVRLIFDIIDNNDIISVIKRGFKYLGALLFGIFGYVMITRFLVVITGRRLKDYQNLRTMGLVGFKELLNGISSCYAMLITMITGNYFGTSGALMIKLVTAVVYALLLVFIIKNLIDIKKDFLRVLLLVALILIFPISINLVLLMGAEETHSVMVYSVVMLYMTAVIVTDRIGRVWKQKARAGIVLIMTICFLQLILVYVHMANVVYMEMELAKEEAQSYLTTIITQIKSLDGYDPDMLVTFSGKLNDDNLTDLRDQFSYLEITGMDNARGIITMRRKADYLKYYCGFNNTVVHVRDSGVDIDIINAMPDYPHQGSIKIIDNVIVVKLSEWHE